MDTAHIAHQLEQLLGLRSHPIAIAFREEAPVGVPRVAGAGPSGCSYWARAAEGDRFFTEASDHFGCPIGAYTHGIELPREQGDELENVLGMMSDVQYIQMEEVPDIPRREGQFRVAVYAPLAQSPTAPDVVLIRGDARQVMLLAEAAHALPAAGRGMMGRPTCAAIPEAMRSNTAVASLGCIGNRVYTGLADDELYFAVPGGQVEALVRKLETIVGANRALEEYHRGKIASAGGA